jgi:glutamine amidotransferase
MLSCWTTGRDLRNVVRGGTSAVSPITDRAADLLNARAAVMPGWARQRTRCATCAGTPWRPCARFIASGRPFLGVCMGLHALLSYSEEGGRHECLDVIPGVVRRLPDGQKVPHMGWNTVSQIRPHPIFEGVPDESYFYFVHSYHAEPDDEECIIGVTEYGRRFAAAIARENVVATQFHPEKSGATGLRIYANFLAGVSAAVR